MAVTLRGSASGGRLEVAGDIQATLRLPFTDASLFYLSFSDGTLIEGDYDYEQAYRFRLHTEGAGLSTIRREGDQDVLEVAWNIEWVTIASFERCAYLVGHDEPIPVLPGFVRQLTRATDGAGPLRSAAVFSVSEGLRQPAQEPL